MLTDGTTTSFTVIVIKLLVIGEVQAVLEVKTTVTLSVLISDVEVNVGILVPTFMPFTFH